MDSGEKGNRVVSTIAVRDTGRWAAISLQGESLTKRVHPRLFHRPVTRTASSPAIPSRPTGATS